ncbi:MAG: alpha/beta fold hydrolase, partial [Pseudomonadota bacterium]
GLWLNAIKNGNEFPKAPVSRYITPQDQFVEVDGATIRVRQEGPIDGTPLILLHGFTYSLETWDRWAEELATSYRVIRYDLLGHGLTGPDKRKRYTPHQRADFLASVMDALGIEKANLAGNSLGGLVAWRFAAQNPDHVEKLILIAPAAYPINGVTDDPAPIPPTIDQFMRYAPDSGVRISLELLYGDSSLVTNDRVALAGHMMKSAENGEAFIDHLEAFTLPNPTADLAKIIAPTLIMWGRSDGFIPPTHAAMMRDAIPNAELALYSGIGHLPQEEAPIRTVTDAKRFLEMK